MTIAIGRKGKADLQGGKPPKIIRSGRKVTITAAGVPPDVVEVNGHAKNGKPKKPRGAAGIPAIEGVLEDVNKDLFDELAANYAAPPLQKVMGPGMKVEATPPPVATKPQTLLVHLSNLMPSPTNPRKRFDEAELTKLAESIRDVGLLQPILVRPLAGGKFQIVAGERRFRAAHLAGLENVDVNVRDLDDYQALKVQWTENAERDDISAIEEAEHFRRMLDTRPGLTQQQLGDELGVSQGQVANRLRMLELPEEVRSKVISREIPPTHARALLPWIKAKAVITAVLKDVSDWIKKKEELPNLEGWDDHIEHAAGQVTYPLDGSEWGGTEFNYQHIKWSIPLADREALGVVELPAMGYGAKGTEERATNKKAWQSAKTKAIAAAKAKMKKAGNKKADRQASAAKRVISPAERKKLDQQRAKQLATRIADWRTNWLRELCWWFISEGDAGEVAMRMIIVAARADWFGFRDKKSELDAMIKVAGITYSGKPHQHWNDHQRYEACRTLDFEQLPKLATALVKSRLMLDGEPQSSIEPPLVEMLAEDLKVDLAKAWKEAAGTARAEGFFALHDKTQLAKLAAELKVNVDPEGKRSAMIEALLEAKPTQLPGALARRAR
jgi:ParB/RepB/Spo0J family partition protein